MILWSSLVLAQSTAPPEAPTQVKVTPSHLQVTGLTGDQVVITWKMADCPKGVTNTHTTTVGARTMTITCLP